jgi:hypothetical protein
VFISALNVGSSEETRIPIPFSTKLNLIDRQVLFNLNPSHLTFIDDSIVGVESCHLPEVCRLYTSHGYIKWRAYAATGPAYVYV